MDNPNIKSINLVGSFPDIGEVYQANALKCCFATPVGSNENLIIPCVVVEIHPKTETSKVHLIGGWGSEVRYGGNQHFKVIDKYYKVEEVDFGSGIKREVKGYIIEKFNNIIMGKYDKSVGYVYTHQ